jgi:hypothetical protein
MEVIAAQLGVNQATITRDLDSLCTVHKPPRPKGGRPKGSRKTRAAPKTDKVQSVVDALVRDGEPVPRKKLAAEYNVGTMSVQNAHMKALGKLEAEPQIRPEDLSMTAQQKLDLAIRPL